MAARPFLRPIAIAASGLLSVGAYGSEGFVLFAAGVVGIMSVLGALVLRRSAAGLGCGQAEPDRGAAAPTVTRR
jgi:hypothetical protein